MDRLHLALGQEITDPDDEVFLLFSQDIPSSNLGFVDAKTAELDVQVGNRQFTIHQSPGLLTSNRSEGTTGAVLWKVTPSFADWISRIDNVLFDLGFLHAGANVVELGCGISGVLALSLAPLVGKYIATDQDYVLKVLRQNLAENSAKPNQRQPRGKAAFSARPSSSSSSQKIQAYPLDWETDDVRNLLTYPALIAEGRVDAVLACDCIYNEALVEPFVSTCADLCRLNISTDNPTVCVVAQQLRSPDVFEAWLHAFCRRFTTWRVPEELLSSDLREGSGFVVHIGILKTP